MKPKGFGADMHTRGAKLQNICVGLGVTVYVFHYYLTLSQNEDKKVNNVSLPFIYFPNNRLKT